MAKTQNTKSFAKREPQIFQALQNNPKTHRVSIAHAFDYHGEVFRNSLNEEQQKLYDKAIAGLNTGKPKKYGVPLQSFLDSLDARQAYDFNKVADQAKQNINKQMADVITTKASENLSTKIEEAKAALKAQKAAEAEKLAETKRQQKAAAVKLAEKIQKEEAEAQRLIDEAARSQASKPLQASGKTTSAVTPKTPPKSFAEREPQIFQALQNNPKTHRVSIAHAFDYHGETFRNGLSEEQQKLYDKAIAGLNTGKPRKYGVPLQSFLDSLDAKQAVAFYRVTKQAEQNINKQMANVITTKAEANQNTKIEEAKAALKAQKAAASIQANKAPQADAAALGNNVNAAEAQIESSLIVAPKQKTRATQLTKKPLGKTFDFNPDDLLTKDGTLNLDLIRQAAAAGIDFSKPIKINYNSQNYELNVPEMMQNPKQIAAALKPVSQGISSLTPEIKDGNRQQEAANSDPDLPAKKRRKVTFKDPLEEPSPVIAPADSLSKPAPQEELSAPIADPAPLAVHAQPDRTILDQVRALNVIQAGTLLASDPALLAEYEKSKASSINAIEFMNLRDLSQSTLNADNVNALQQDSKELFKEILALPSVTTLKPRQSDDPKIQNFDIKFPTNKTFELKQTTTTNQGLETSRNVELPNELPGKADVMLQLLDSKGKPTDLYFSAHYDEKGKLVEMFTPQPVKFKGDDPKSLAVVEVDGQELSLPINRGQFNSMNLAIAKNKGLSQEQINSMMPEQKQINSMMPEQKQSTLSQLAEQGKEAIKTLLSSMSSPSQTATKQTPTKEPSKGKSGRGM